jgi:hypothetical protein
VLAERAAGLCTLFVTAAVVFAADAPLVALALAAVAAVAWAISRPSLRRLSARHHAGVWVWSCIALTALLGMVAAAAAAVGAPTGPRLVITLGIGLLAGMSVPLSVGGWGPREAAGALAALLVGVPPTVGVTLAAGYGLLSTVSVLPGFLTLGHDPKIWRARRRGRQVELDAHVLAESETP